jgi:hypothetical protein
VRYDLPIFDFASAAGGNPMAVKVQSIVGCPGITTGCTPDAGAVIPFAVTPPTSAAAPYYQIDLPYNFDGSILMMAAGYIPTEYFLGGPLVGTALPDGGPILDKDGTPVVVGLAIAPTTYLTLDDFFGDLMLTRDPTKGLIVARLLDCNGNRAANVVLEIKNYGMGQGFTLLNGGYTPVTGQPPPPTEGRGVSGYANMTPGTYVVDAIAPNGNHYGATAAVVVANTLTLLEIRTDNQHNVGR